MDEDHHVYYRGSEREQWFDATHDGLPVEPAQVIITVTDGAGTVTTPSVTRAGNRYTAIVPHPVAGTYKAVATTPTGAFIGVGKKFWRVREQDEKP